VHGRSVFGASCAKKPCGTYHSKRRAPFGHAARAAGRDILTVRIENITASINKKQQTAEPAFKAAVRAMPNGMHDALLNPISAIMRKRVSRIDHL
jgi:hypothetical protein